MLNPHIQDYFYIYINYIILFRDLIDKDGVIFEIGEDYQDNDESFSFSPFVQLNNKDI